MQVEQALNENSSNLENVYISGIDSTVTEMEIAELFRYTTQGETQVKFYENNINNRTRIITEVQLQKEKAVMAHSKLNGQKIKDCVMKLIPQSCMKQLVLTNLPIVFSEKDMYLILNSRTEGLKSITIADDPQELGKTQQKS
ncbi:hypothetical protein PPERSA_11259 [Pseudocohnilembus persalinus]|uniref:RRM domain-containing protein n=1 Tax=Pseudocohnilembus persalinus TaxID=266149 RepID=A0A0V0QZN2_PSEPJ|nr:hypothetical protein PPERSA_11259 [Pseudocohnilembus persalinus]|eukprot:KRX07710.1 hypothetical protein PPERSA_11259 [Pseudocohnilembus persalinus]